jgi:hypothetical protein
VKINESKFRMQMDRLEELIREKMEFEREGKPFRGDVAIKMQIYSHGITSLRFQSSEDIK